MNTRERFHAALDGRPFDRLPLAELAIWWDETIERWQTEGLPADLDRKADAEAIRNHFGLDNIMMTNWFQVHGADCPKAQRHGAGIVETETDYERVKQHLFPWPCIDREFWESWAQKQRAGDAVVNFGFFGFFWFPRTLFGIERHLYAFYDQPELMQRMNRDLVSHQLRVLDAACEICTPDFVYFAEDMSYNHGPMLSEDLFGEFMRPWYEAMVPELKKRGVTVIVDSDGDITEAVPWFLNVGVDGFFPLERQSGVDIPALREEYPDLLFLGGFDKMTMTRGEAAMREEFERLLPVAADGGFIISCDHQTPPGVSYEQYQLYLSLFREYADTAGALSLDLAGDGDLGT